MMKRMESDIPDINITFYKTSFHILIFLVIKSSKLNTPVCLKCLTPPDVIFSILESHLCVLIDYVFNFNIIILVSVVSMRLKLDILLTEAFP